MEISEKGREMLAFQERLAKEYGYKPIEPNLYIGDVRKIYEDALPSWCKKGGDSVACLRTMAGTVIARGYSRIVIGDYGAFLEISSDNICKEVLQCKKGQEYRCEDSRFADTVKYIWLTVNDDSDCKIYWQRKTVSYADYRPGMYYISPYEVNYLGNTNP